MGDTEDLLVIPDEDGDVVGGDDKTDGQGVEAPSE
jgi:hypothetical protein